MSYNKFNPRYSNRFPNIRGNFIPASDSGPRPNYRHMPTVNSMQFNKPHEQRIDQNNQQWNHQQSHQKPQMQIKPQPQEQKQQLQQLQPQQQQQSQQQVQKEEPHLPKPQPQRLLQQPQAQTSQESEPQQGLDAEMKSESVDCNADKPTRPFWMKTKLQGVKKITNRERRRRQNETLRRLLAPKNALMVLNEMMPGEAIATQFKVEPMGDFGSYSRATHAFHAELKLESNVYKGYGETKMAARNAAAEQAIRDLIIKRMTRVIQDNVKQEAAMETDGAAEGAAESETEGAAEGETECETMPMIQLASFALHKLFSEWECGGHRVPQLKINPSSNGDACSDCPNPTPVKKVRQLPEHAATMHPCMLLTYMRPQLAYRPMATEGDRPQNMMYSVAIDVDGQTFFGKASSKKDARRQAARDACETVFGVKFQTP